MTLPTPEKDQIAQGLTDTAGGAHSETLGAVAVFAVICNEKTARERDPSPKLSPFEDRDGGKQRHIHCFLSPYSK
jgi:hypothetical protein